MKPLYVHAVGVAAPGLQGWAQARPVRAGAQPWLALPETPYAPQLLPPNERRRAPPGVRQAFRAAEDAQSASSFDFSQLAAVFASSDSDLTVMDRINRALAEPVRAVSPTDFHNSVHNAAAGYWSIATGCHEPYCALSAGRYTFANGLFAAALQVCADQTDVLYVAYDIDARGPQTQITHSQGILGVALVLTPDGSGTRLELAAVADRAADTAFAASANAMADSLPLVVALERGAVEVLRLPLGPESALQVQVRHR
jgi:hypothetical protein